VCAQAHAGKFVFSSTVGKSTCQFSDDSGAVRTCPERRFVPPKDVQSYVRYTVAAATEDTRVEYCRETVAVDPRESDEGHVVRHTALTGPHRQCRHGGSTTVIAATHVSAHSSSGRLLASTAHPKSTTRSTVTLTPWLVSTQCLPPS